jgi:hypothetical protein
MLMRPLLALEGATASPPAFDADSVAHHVK